MPTLTHTPGLRRRKVVNRAMEVLATLSAVIAVAALLLVVVAVVKRGAGALNADFFTRVPATFGQTGGGIQNAIVGTIVIVLCAAAMALPVGVLVALYLSELAPRPIARFVGLLLDVLNGLPSIVIGIFVFGLVVLHHGQSTLAGAFALAIIMLPLVARSTQEVLALVPSTLREAGLALGVSRWRTVVGVVLPTSFGGVLTGATLAIARAAGETAPLLFTCSVTATYTSWDPRQALQTIPLTIFEYLESPNPDDHQKAWAAALVLMAFVLVTSLLSKAILARSRRKLTR